jgi:hypothetical protein
LTLSAPRPLRLPERVADQLLQRFIVENLKPLEVRERSRLRFGQLLRHAKLHRDGHFRPFVIRANGASAQQNGHGKGRNSAFQSPSAGAGVKPAAGTPRVDSFSTT